MPENTAVPILSAKMAGAYKEDPIVQRIIDSGGNADDCVEALLEECRYRMKQVMNLTMIAPRKIKRKDGTEYVWHCPDNLVTFTGIEPRASCKETKPDSDRTVTVADTIAHLMTFPPDMEVWTTWDESGEYWPATKPQARIDHVRKVEIRGREQWRERSEEPNGGPTGTKAVCVLSAEMKV